MRRQDEATADPVQASEAEALDGAEDLLELVLAAHEVHAVPLPARIDGVMVGRLVALDAVGRPQVTYAGCPAPGGIPARAMAALGEADVGRDAALLFEGGDPERPVVMGLMFQPAASPSPPAAEDAPGPTPAAGERVEIAADREIVLRCGEASITLTRAGKIIIRGAYVSTRASGVNRIQGGSVQIN